MSTARRPTNETNDEVDKDEVFIKQVFSTNHPKLRDLLHSKSTTLPPPVLVNNCSVSTHSSPPLQGSQYHQFPACTLLRTN